MIVWHITSWIQTKINKIPVLESGVDKRMDLAIFDVALSYTVDPENINSITIVELKRPQRDDGDNDANGIARA